MTGDSEFVRDAVEEVVAAQLRDDAPPEARRTLTRLVASGYTDGEARTLIGCALSREMFEVLASGGAFDERRYVASLDRLPAAPVGGGQWNAAAPAA